MWLRELLRFGPERNRLWRGYDAMAKARFITSKSQPFLPGGGHHLDIACGSGHVMLTFGEVGYRSTGIELEVKRLAKCRRKNLNVVQADISFSLPVTEGAFKVVTLISVIEHIPDPRALLTEVWRVLSPGGLLIIQIPNPYFPIDLHYYLPFYGFLPPSIQTLYRRLFTGQGYIIDYHTSQMTKEAIRTLLADYTLIYQEDIVYPAVIAPEWLRPFYKLYSHTFLHRLFPTGHLFIYRKPTPGA
jgi:SAM-dependent methyltransferase